MTNPQNNAPGDDPLLSAMKKPAVSFKGQPVGTVTKLNVTGWSREAQTTDFRTKLPAFWPAKPGEAQGNPKMAVVYDVTDEQGEELTLWAPRPSSMLTALAKAQTDSGSRIGPGGTLEIQFYDTKPSDKGEDQKLYRAKYTPGVTPPPTDTLTSGGSVSKTSATDPWSNTPVVSDEPPF